MSLSEESKLLTLNFRKTLINQYKKNLKRPIDIYSYKAIFPYLLEDIYHISPTIQHFPYVIPNWDTTPRKGLRGLVLHNSTPELFRIYLRQAVEKVLDKPQEQRLVFIKSWNEWAEGNYLEPDLRYGRAYLEILRDEIFSASKLKISR